MRFCLRANFENAIAFYPAVCYNYRMKYTDIGGIRASRLCLGNMRIADKPIENIERLVNVALDMGVNMFDHADIYGGARAKACTASL